MFKLTPYALHPFFKQLFDVAAHAVEELLANGGCETPSHRHASELEAPGRTASTVCRETKPALHRRVHSELVERRNDVDGATKAPALHFSEDVVDAWEPHLGGFRHCCVQRSAVENEP